MARLYRRPGSPFWWTWGRYADGTKWYASTRKRRKADAAPAAIRIAAERGELLRTASEALTVKQAFDDVIIARRREGKVEGTERTYVRTGRHACRIFGADTAVDSLTRADLERYIGVRLAEKSRTGTVKRSTVAMELSKLRATLRYAGLHGRYSGDVQRIWPREALRKAYKSRERYLTREEYARLHAELERRAGRGDWLAGYVYTGCRKSELRRITAADVDLAALTVRIRGTKTDPSDRVIPIAPALRPVVERRMEGLAEGAPLWPLWHYAKVVNNSTRALGMPAVNANDLRRTFCSWLAQAGVPEGACARLMGHGSTRMVRSVYARFGSADLSVFVARL